MLEHVLDSDTYTPIQLETVNKIVRTITEYTMDLVEDYCECFDHIYDNYLRNFIKLSTPKIITFYVLIKIHKPPRMKQGIPKYKLRPVAVPFNWIATEVSR